MKILVFDTETTGLPKNRNPAYNAPDNWPHLVSVSWTIFDSETNKIEKERNYIIYPESWVIPEDSTEIHGITHLKAVQEGIPLKNAMIEFISDNYDIMIAHNMDFDENVMVNAIRWDMKTLFDGFSKPRYCSMSLTRKLCNLKNRNGWSGTKSPKLKELYEIVTGKKPDEKKLHSSAYDVALLVEVVQTCPELRSQMGLTDTSIKSNNGVHSAILHI